MSLPAGNDERAILDLHDGTYDNGKKCSKGFFGSEYGEFRRKEAAYMDEMSWDGS
jgi:hypothetical protein